MAFLVVGVTWVGLIRRNIRLHSESIRQREAALEAHYRELFENAHDIIFTHDLGGNLISLNHAGEQILGYSREEAAHLNLGKLASAASAKRFQQALDRLGAGESGAHFELDLRAKNGRAVILRVNLRRQQDPGGADRIQGIAWDITGQKEAEEALRASEHRLRQSLEERVQLGRDLHDGIIQSIYAIGLGLGECRRLIEEKPEEASVRLGRAITDLNVVIRDVRNFIGGLEPQALKEGEFKAAIESLVGIMSEAHAARFSFDIDPRAAARLSSRQAAHLLQIAREAMSNSVRHSGASGTVVSLAARNDHVRLEVNDDGTGFDVDLRDGDGHGLRNISSRVQEIGGALQIESGSGKGTRVSVTVPVKSVS